VAAVAAVVLAAGAIGAYEYVKAEKANATRAAEEAAERQAAEDQRSAAAKAAADQAAKDQAAKDQEATQKAADQAAAKAAADQAAKDRAAQAARDQAARDQAAQAARDQAAQAARDQAARDQAARRAAEQAAAVPNLAGTWLEIHPKDPANPLRLKVVQSGTQITCYISYTQVFSGRADLQATINGGRATTSLPQECAPRFQKPGYNYDNPGVNIFNISLRGSTLVYEQDTKWTSPCDGHPIGVEQNVRALQRIDAQ
jgi:hypothetical protein